MRELLQKLNKLNVSINIIDDKLDIEAPKGVMTEVLLAEIKNHKEELKKFIISRLSSAKTEYTPISPSIQKNGTTLSSSQQQLWIVSQIDSDNSAYNLSSAFKISGILNESALHKAIEVLVKRHESFRTVFKLNQKGDVRQYVKSFSDINFKISHQDFSGKKNQNHRFRNRIQEEVSFQFDLALGPLFRIGLFKLGEKEHVFTMTMHHIISDGWSLEIINKEIFTLYEAFCKRNTNPLPALKIQYRDYAVWQQNQLQAGSLDQDKKYWLKKFNKKVTRLVLPGEKVNLNNKTSVGGQIKISYQSNVIQQFKTLCKENDSNLYLGLLSVIKLLLYKYTAKNDVVIGTPVSGREHPDTQSQVGFYVNLLGLRSHIDDSKSFVALLKMVQENALEAFNHQNYPFDALMQEVSFEGNQFFDIIVTLKNKEDEINTKKQVANLTIENFPTAENIISKFGLEFVFVDTDQGLDLLLTYDKNLYEDNFSKQLTKHVMMLLDQIVRHPSLKTSAFSLISEKEKRELTVGLNKTTLNYPLEKTFLDMFKIQVEQSPNAFAVDDGEDQLSYLELDTLSNQVAVNLIHTYGVEKEDIIGVKLDRGKWLVISILGILKAGGAYLPIDPEYPKDRILFIEKDSACKITIDVALIEVLARSKNSSSVELPILKPDNLGYVIYTSGSTGKPKGVMVEHRNLMNLCFWHNTQYKVNYNSKATLFSSIAFDASIWELFPYLMVGACLYPITDRSIRTDTLKLITFLIENNITHTYLPTQICQSFVHDKIELKSLTILTGGDVLTLGSKSNLSIYNNYGPTENTVVTTFYELHKNKIENIPIGKPIANTKIYLLDNSLNLVPFGFTGRLFVAGHSVTRGYLNRPELTEEKFLENPFIKGGRMYDTGDLARYLPDGNLVFMGRQDQQIKLRGFRIELGEIEQELVAQDSIEQAVTAIKNNEGQKMLVAYIVSKFSIDNQLLKTKLREKLPNYMIPACFVKINNIPLSANGKIDREALPQPEEKDLVDTLQLVKPKTKLEKQLAAIWKEVLKINSIGTNTILFDVGGSSISAAKIINKIKSQTGYELEFNEFIRNPTIQGIIPFLKKHSYESIPRVGLQENYPLTPTQFRFWLLCQMPEVNKTYNIPFTIKLEGVFNYQAFQDALQKVIERYEILRTSFVKNSNGEIRQQIQPYNPSLLKTPLDFLKDQQSLNAAISNFNKVSFNLAEAPLFNVHLFSTEQDVHFIAFNFHHIIFDGESLQILMQELSLIYNNLCTETEVNLPEPIIQYKDYSEWYNHQNLELKNKELDFWLNEFAGELPVLNIPTYQKRPSIQTYTGNTVSHPFDTEVYTSLRNFTKQYKTTEFITLLTALNGLLYRYTNQTDIIVGIPVLSREHPDLENQIGLFINAIPLRLRFDEDIAFEDLATRQKDVLLKAHANAGISFGDIINGLKLKRDPSRSPVFDVLVIYQKHDSKDFNTKKSFNNLECSPYESKTNSVSKYDITFSFVDYEDNLNLTVEYNIDLYQKSFIENLILNFENFLKSCLEFPTLKINDISYLNQSQSNELLNLFNRTDQILESNFNIVNLFGDQVIKTPEKIAIVCEGNEISYKELHEKSSQLALHLIGRGVTTGSIVGIFFGRSIEILIAILGILKSGASYLPLDPFYPINRLDHILKDSNAKVVITTSHTHPILPQGLDVIDINDGSIWENGINLDLPEIIEQSIAYVIYTSGSTGKPKGVKVSHKNLGNFLAGMNSTFPTRSEADVWMAMTSISFDISILELLWTLTYGSKVILHLERPVPITTKPKMDFSLFYFPTHSKTADGNDKYKLLIEGAKFGDENQFEAIWVPERHFHNFGDQFPNPSIAAAAVSTITKNIKLRSGSVVLPLHDPVRVAEEWSMVDNLSNGRVELSIASGWHPNDFVLSPDNYENRHEVMRNGIDTLKNLWQGKTLLRKNGLGKDFEFSLHPKPIQKTLNLWITAAGSIDTFKYAGSIGANILTHLLGQNIQELKEKIKVYRRTLVENGFDSENFKVALMLHTFVSDDLDFVQDTVEKPFKSYLKNSLNLLKPIAEEQDLDLENDIDPLLQIGYKRFYKSSSLFGTPESCLEMVNEVYDCGINEIACLIDFGVNEDLVIENFKHLQKLKEFIARSKKQHDYIVNRMHKLTAEEETVALIKNHKVTHMQSTPTFYEEFLANPIGKKTLKNIHTVLVGGEALKQSLAKLLQIVVGENIYNMYGPTEATIWSTVKKVDSTNKISIGSPIINTKIYILDKKEQLCPIGVSGELYIGGDGVTLGYLNNEALTSSRYIENPFVENEIIYKTGDLASWLPNGELQFHGRFDDQVKLRGYRIELQEIENVIYEHTPIHQCVVCIVEKEEQSVLAAFIKSKKEVAEQELKQILKLHLPHYMIPQYITRLSEFPLTPNGKIDINKLPRPNQITKKAKQIVPPKNETEEELIQVWSDFLKIDSISVEDNFFEIGGNSMKAFQLLTMINKALDINLNILSFFQYPTIRDISDHIMNVATSQDIIIEDNEMEDVEDFIDYMDEI